MTLADRVMERFRKRLARWVEKERAAVGCADVAIKRVASKLGMSAMGVRRVLGRYGSVKVQAHHFVALLIHTLKTPRRRMTMTVLRSREMA
jgi:hypothetical protein